MGGLFWVVLKLSRKDVLTSLCRICIAKHAPRGGISSGFGFMCEGR